ncbi:MAG TPA: VWA domain-containing protein [Steroidobacteraceae bacterium]|nr:VWA domain-containing protein [Steroidobacteraceae bacterium]
MSRLSLAAKLFAFLLVSTFAYATSPSNDDDDRHLLEEIVVTGMRATQGGAQDINYFRGAVEQDKIPHPNDLTAEGLFSEHDILFPERGPCRQLFCLTGESMRADLLAVPEARYLVGIGFASNLDPKTWKREPLNLVAVVDKSGSMDGEPLDLVRQSLLEITKQLKPDDQVSIVLYGDTSELYLRPTKVDSRGRKAITAAIRGIESNGSTSMEAGLKVGYKVAFDTAPQFKGTTRLMLFTDERPNVGATDADSFMGMAIAASKRKIGLTTIGVGVQFGAELATKISSVRGGNLYFIRDENDVRSVYVDQLDYMVSELAHDLDLTLAPHSGYRIAGVYGIPGELMTWQNQTVVHVKIPTVFLSNRGGAIFLALARDPDSTFVPEHVPSPEETLATVSVSYVPAGIRTSSLTQDTIDIAAASAMPSPGIQLGHALVDEFTVLHKSTTAHYIQNDQETAYQLVHAFKGRLQSVESDDMHQEQDLIARLDEQFAFLSGHSSEAPRRSRYAQLWGMWKIERIEGSGADIHRGEYIEFTPDNDFRVYSKDSDRTKPREEDTYEYNNNQLHIIDSELVFNYVTYRKSLQLRHRSGVVIYLSKVG